jgi:hypothetical protein
LTDLDRRLIHLERYIARCRPGGHEPLLIRVSGGLPGELRHASAGGLWLERQPGETLEGFETRALGLAREVGAPFAVVGGLPPDADAVGAEV